MYRALRVAQVGSHSLALWAALQPHDSRATHDAFVRMQFSQTAAATDKHRGLRCPGRSDVPGDLSFTKGETIEVQSRAEHTMHYLEML